DRGVFESPQSGNALLDVGVGRPSKNGQDLAVGRRLRMPCPNQHHGNQIPNSVGLLSPLRSPDGGVVRKAAAQDRWRMSRRAAVNIRIMLVDLHHGQRLSERLLG